jgi:hypothetical protein
MIYIPPENKNIKHYERYKYEICTWINIYDKWITLAVCHFNGVQDCVREMGWKFPQNMIIGRNFSKPLWWNMASAVIFLNY